MKLIYLLLIFLIYVYFHAQHGTSDEKLHTLYFHSEWGLQAHITPSTI